MSPKLIFIFFVVVIASIFHSSHALKNQDHNTGARIKRFTTGSGNNSLQVKILALFSGSSHDLGLDHRLGGQVLKLAVARARRINPELSNIELQVINESSDCNNASRLVPQVAELFYARDRDATSTKIARRSYNRTLNIDRQDVCQLRENYNDNCLAPVDAILGPSCDQLVDPLARMAAYWRVPIYTVTSISSSFGRKDVYPTLTRLSPSIGHLSTILVRIMERFRWRHLALVVDVSQVENVIIMENLDQTIERLRYSYPIYRTIFSFSSFRNLNSTAKPEVETETISEVITTSIHCTPEAREMFAGIGRVARVILLLINEPQIVRRLLLCAHELRLNNGEYTFLALNLGLKSGTISGPRQLSYDWFVQDDEANNLKARQMFESLMIISVELPISDELNLFIEQTLDLAHQEFPEVQFERSSVGPIAVAMHDSLLLAVEAQKRHLLSLGENRTSKSYTHIVQQDDDEFEQDYDDKKNRKSAQPPPLMWGQRYTGGLITNMHINLAGDQELDYVLSDMEPELGVMRPVASYAKDTRQLVPLPATYIHWPGRLDASTGKLLHNDEPPLDEPECGFMGDSERCIERQNLYIALGVVCLFLTIISLVIGLSVHRYQEIRYQMQLDDYWWKINWNELHFLRPGGRHQQPGHHQQPASLTSHCATSFLARQIRPTGTRNGNGPAGSVVSISSQLPVRVPLIVTTPTAAKAPSSAGAPSDFTATGSEPEVKHQKQVNSRPPPPPPRVSPSLIGSQVALSLIDGKSSLLEVGSNVIRTSELSAVVRESSLAVYKNELVIVKQLNGRALEMSRSLLVELKIIRELANENLARLVGLCVEPQRLAVVYEFCSRGNLQDLLLNPAIAIDWNLKCSIMGDLINGLAFIHTTLLDCHGRLKSTNLVLDGRFTVKLTDFGLRNLYNQLELIETHDHDDDDDDDDEDEVDIEPECQHDDPFNELLDEVHEQQQAGARESAKLRKPSIAQTIYNMDSVSMRAENLTSSRVGGGRRGGVSMTNSRMMSGGGRGGVDQSYAGTGNGGGEHKMRMKNRSSARFFWTAPEHLRQRQPHLAASKRGDIYSLAIVLYEIFTRKEPYYYGTNAKPRWALIKCDKLRHQATAGVGGEPVSRRVGVATGSGGARHSITTAGGSQVKVMSNNSQTGDGSSVVSRPSAALPVHGRRKRRSAVGPAVALPVGMHPDQQMADSVKISMTAGAGPEPETIGEEDEQQQRSGSVVSRETTRQLRPAPAMGVADEAHDQVLDGEQILDQLRMGIQPEPIRPYIPNYLLQEVDSRLVAVLRSCWSEIPSARPTASQVRNSLRKITRGATAKNYLDNLLNRLQSYAAQLEQIVDSKSADIMAEKMRTEELLYQLVPKFVADKLKCDEPIIPQVFDGVTIFFSDIVGFEKYASVMSPSELIDLLNNIYSSFESIISSFDVTKIEVILDQFLVAAGISLDRRQSLDGATNGAEPPQPRLNGEGAGQEGGVAVAATPTPPPSKPKRRLMGALRSKSSSLSDKKEPVVPVAAATSPLPVVAQLPAEQQAAEHYKRSSAEQIARMALCIRDLVKSFHFRQNLNNDAAAAESTPEVAGSQSPQAPEVARSTVNTLVATTFNIRVGIHSGKVCAGIVGAKRPKFCLIGDTVNVASRMHTNSKANRIQVSADTRQLLKSVPGFSLEPRGRIDVKGKGPMETYWLESSY